MTSHDTTRPGYRLEQRRSTSFPGPVVLSTSGLSQQKHVRLIQSVSMIAVL